MTRIVAGRLGGRRLSTPAGPHTRPTSERVREALFNTLASLTELSGSRVADLYAGSGAVGLEACSHGAAHVLLVESAPRAARAARANIAALGVAGTVTLLTRPVEAVLAAGPEGGPYQIVFADPPYDLPDHRLVAVLRALVTGDWLAPDAVLVVERATRAGAPPWVEPVTALRARRYGETTLWYGQRS